eukprot:COSAG06_NODE_662_length_13299_cov_6.298182_9_plen_73_part_00
MSDVSGQERVICPACVLCFALVLYSALCGMCGMCLLYPSPSSSMSTRSEALSFRFNAFWISSSCLASTICIT